jgi:2-(1,2-epoxy-1,2-dihydrophenyl)acetyl-CoA isomerase
VTDGPARVVDTGTDTVLAGVEDRVGIVTLNRPNRRNALHPEMFEAIPRVLEHFAEADDVGCVLITGSGSAFCAGGDVRDGGSAGAQTPCGDAEITARAAQLKRSARMVELLHQLPKPTVAALPGAAVGAGMSIALSTDLRIAARSARLIAGWGQLAFSGDFGGTWFLVRLVGPSRAMEILVDGSPIDSERALSLGLFNKVVDDADLVAAAMAWAAQIAAGPTSTWTAVKANIADAQWLPLATALDRESERMVRSAMSDAHRRAVRVWLKANSIKDKQGQT